MWSMMLFPACMMPLQKHDPKTILPSSCFALKYQCQQTDSGSTPKGFCPRFLPLSNTATGANVQVGLPSWGDSNTIPCTNASGGPEGTGCQGVCRRRSHLLPRKLLPSSSHGPPEISPDTELSLVSPVNWFNLLSRPMETRSYGLLLTDPPKMVHFIPLPKLPSAFETTDRSVVSWLIG